MLELLLYMMGKNQANMETTMILQPWLLSTTASADDNENTHDAEDDWEAAFDALHIQGASSDQIQHNELKDSHERKPNGVHHLDLQGAMLKPEYMYKNNGFGGRRGNSGRAWRPDDIS
jgi:hypothetical protein